MIEKICKQCNKLFQTYEKNRKYCNSECYNKSRIGKKFSEKRCENISKALKGYKHSDEFKSKARKRQLGVKRTEQSKNKTSESLRKKHKEKKWGFGTKPPWNKGMKGFQAGIPRHAYNEKFREKIRETSKKRIPWNKNLNKDKDKRLKSVSEKMTGKNNPAYINGQCDNNKYPTEFDRATRRRIRERDNKTCKICGITEEQLTYKLGIHHIDYNKKNNVDGNYVCLCKSCHAKTNWNRKEWQKKLKKVIDNGRRLNE